MDQTQQRMCGGMQSMGGTHPPKDATEEIQKLCDKVKADAEAKAETNFELFIAKTYTQQIVCGTNYFIKVHVGGDDQVHLRIHKELPCYGGAIKLHGIQLSKTVHDPVEYF